jgi:hypothetical protein
MSVREAADVSAASLAPVRRFGLTPTSPSGDAEAFVSDALAVAPSTGSLACYASTLGAPLQMREPSRR